jgi:hypothetical protein
VTRRGPRDIFGGFLWRTRRSVLILSAYAYQEANPLVPAFFDNRPVMRLPRVDSAGDATLE